MAGIARSLRHRNYRLFFAGQMVSVAGTWMQQIGMSWLAYRLTGSTFLLGLISFCSLIPLLPFGPFGGLLADRFDNRRLLLVTQTCAMLQAVLLSVLFFSGLIQPWHLVALALLMGLISTVDIPTRQAFMVDLVEDRNDLPNAIALNSSVFNGARLIGPAIGGFIVHAFGEGVCFVINALSYLAVILALAAIRTHHARTLPGAPLEALRQAMRYVRSQPRIIELMLLVASLGLFVMPYQVLIPYFAKQVFAGDAHTYGQLMAANGAGALCGALYLARRSGVHGLTRSIARATLLGAVCLAVFAATDHLEVALVSLFVLGFCTFFSLSSSNTCVQSQVRDDMRGRVLSLYYVALAGFSPLGSLMGGWFGEHIGARVTLLCGAGISLAIALAFRNRWGATGTPAAGN